MGRKTNQTIKEEKRQQARERRTARFIALSELLADKVEQALIAAEPTDSKELKQISSILKELMAMQDISSEEIQRERELHLLRLEREARAEQERADGQLIVHFEGGDEAWGD